MMKPSKKRHSTDSEEGPEAKIQCSNEEKSKLQDSTLDFKYRGKSKHTKDLQKQEKPGKHSKLHEKTEEEGSETRKNTELQTFKNKNKSEHKKGKHSEVGPGLYEKPNWTEIKTKNKELRKTRKEKKTPFFDATVKSKQLWEKVRRNDCSPEEQKKLVNEIYKLLKGNFKKFVYTHDVSRIVQWLIKLGPSDIKENVIEELSSVVPTMLQSKYARSCVKNMLKFGSNNSRRAIVHSLYGQVVKLTRHTVAAPLFEEIYLNWATASEKNQLRQEFYGDMYKQDKETGAFSLVEIFENTPSMKNAILNILKTNVTALLKKKLTKSSILHSVLLEFLKHCTKQDADEIYLQIQDCLIDFLYTKDGTHIATICFCQASKKGKQSIIKSLKGHVMEIAKSEHGHMLLLAMFDTIDDTVYLNKKLMPELLADLWGLVDNEYGRRVALYLVAHRDPLYFHPSDIKMLTESAALSMNKKDMEVRKSEIRQAILNPLLEEIERDAKKWMSKPSVEMVTLAVLKSGMGPMVKRAYEAISSYICEPSGKITEDGKEYHIVEHAATHMMLKKLILHDKERMKQQEVVTFCSVLASKLSEEILTSWIVFNRGCFLIILLLENAIESVVEDVRMKLLPLAKEIGKQDSTGGKILYKKLKN